MSRPRSTTTVHLVPRLMTVPFIAPSFLAERIPRGGGSFGLVDVFELLFDFFELGSAFGCVGEVFVVEVFGDVTSDSNLSNVVEEGAEFVGCFVEVVGVAIEEGVEEPFAAFAVALA